MTAPVPYKVVVDGRRTAQLWNEYTTRGDVQCACKRLRQLGLDARIIDPGDEQAGVQYVHQEPSS